MTLKSAGFGPDWFDLHKGLTQASCVLSMETSSLFHEDMTVLLDTARDLFIFAFVEWFGFRPTQVSYTRVPATEPFVHVGSLLESKNVSLDKNNDRNSAVVNSPTAHLFVSPVAAFDSVIATVNYGTELTILSSRNRWYEVLYQNKSGWVLADTISLELDRKSEINFKIGEDYEANDPTTKQLRSIIKDSFNGDLVAVPLQNVEYVTYRLAKNNQKILWPDVRPRVAGRWRDYLRGQPGVFISVEPKEGAIMEVVKDDDTGHVAYVEEVFPDQSIIISEVGWPEEGRYGERTLPKEEWREWRPVFISIG